MDAPNSLPGQQGSGGYTPHGLPVTPQSPMYGPAPGPPYAGMGYVGPGPHGLPSGATAKAAAGLGIVLAVIGVGELAFVLFSVWGSGISPWSVLSLAAGYLVTAVMLTAGSVLMFRRTFAGKVTLVVLSVLEIGNGLADIVYNLQYSEYVRAATALLTVIVAAVVLALCLATATRRWLAAGPPAWSGMPFTGQPAPTSPPGPGPLPY